MMKKIIMFGLLAILLISLNPYVLGAPTGATINFQYNSTKNATLPQNRNDTKGTINTVILDAVQQNQKWKAYVGNVTSTFVLDDSGDFTIYQWSMDSFTGQVYISRNDSLTWNSVVCANETHKVTEDTRINHNSGSPDSVNRTFDAQIHRQFTVGTIPFAEAACYSTVTFQNDTQPTHTNGTVFEEVLLWDGDDMIYTTFVENDKPGYHTGYSYDFQAIIPDDGNATQPPLTYYFYLELSS